jgi:hypothetical protein
MRSLALLLLLALAAACDSRSSSHATGAGGAMGGAPGTGGAAGEATVRGGGTGTGGATSALGGTVGTGGSTGTGELAGTGGVVGGAGGAATGGTPRSDAGADSIGRIEAAVGGASEVGGTGRGGARASGGTGAGGAEGSGGARGDAGPDARPDVLGDGARDIGANSSGNDAVTGDGAPCPHSGRVTYTLAKKSNPSATEEQAYSLIKKAMDEAVHYYNCYTDITKQLNVTYDTSVSTADGNVNGSIRFGSGTQYMVTYTAMHEVAHTVGVGQYASSNWLSFVSIPAGGSNGPWKGASAIAELRAITGDAGATLTADHDHFWPYGLNRDTDPHADPDLVAHCRMVVALRKDLGL